VRLADGKLRLEDCTFNVFGGTVTAKGTEAEIWKGRMPFRANLSIKGLDVNQALSAKTKYADTLHGKADLAVELAGEGFETAELEEKLLGKLAVALNEGKFARASLTEAVVGDLSALEKVPGLSLKPIQSENAIRNMAADFEVRDGRFTLKKPMTLTLDGSKVVLTGAIGIAGKLFLQGDYFMAPAVVNKLTAGKCQSNEELKIPVAIGGTVDEPSFTPNGASIALSLAQRCLAGKAGEVAEKLLGDKAKQVLGVSSKEEAEAKARAEAERLKAETEAKARAEADRLKKEAEAKAKAEADRLKAEAEARARAEAERRKEEAKKKAEEEAKKGLKNLFGK
jgi:AsmA protein